MKNNQIKNSWDKISGYNRSFINDAPRSNPSFSSYIPKANRAEKIKTPPTMPSSPEAAMKAASSPGALRNFNISKQDMFGYASALQGRKMSNLQDEQSYKENKRKEAYLKKQFKAINKLEDLYKNNKYNQFLYPTFEDFLKSKMENNQYIKDYLNDQSFGMRGVPGELMKSSRKITSTDGGRVIYK